MKTTMKSILTVCWTAIIVLTIPELVSAQKNSKFRQQSAQQQKSSSQDTNQLKEKKPNSESEQQGKKQNQSSQQPSNGRMALQARNGRSNNTQNANNANPNQALKNSSQDSTPANKGNSKSRRSRSTGQQNLLQQPNQTNQRTSSGGSNNQTTNSNTRISKSNRSNNRQSSQGNLAQENNQKTKRKIIKVDEFKATTDAQGRVSQRVRNGDVVMVRRRYDQKTIDKLVGQGLLTREQAERANNIGRTELERVFEIVSTGQILGADRKVIDAAIEKELSSKGASRIVENEVLVGYVKDTYDLPNIVGADAGDLVDGVAQMALAGLDPSNAQNWRNLNQFKLGKLSGQKVLDNGVYEGDSTANNNQQAGGGPADSSAGDGTDPFFGHGTQPAFENDFDNGSGSGGANNGGSDNSGSDSAGAGSQGAGNSSSSGSTPVDDSGNDSGAGGNGESDPNQPANDAPPSFGEASDDNESQSGPAPLAVVEHNDDGSVTVHYYGLEIDDDGKEHYVHDGTETYTPSGDGTYKGDKGNKLNAKPDEGPHEWDEEGVGIVKNRKDEGKEDQSDSNDDHEDSSNEENEDDSNAGGDSGYTPNWDNGIAAATAENLAWLQARQEWIESGLVNPGNGPRAENPNIDETKQSPGNNPRQGWAINPGPGGGHVQPTVADWTKKFGSIGVADPPKPSVGGSGQLGPSSGPDAPPTAPGNGGPSSGNQ